jgi:hypothetical protein
VTDDREARLQRYLDRQLTDAEQRAFERELLEDPALLADAYDELAVREVLSERRAARRRPRARIVRLWPAVAVAVAACVAFVMITGQPGDLEPRLRGRLDQPPRAVAPVGEVAGPPSTFVWTVDPRATRYRLEVFDRDGQRLFVGTTADTMLAPALGPDPLGAGTWRTTSLDSIGVGFRSTGDQAFRAP